MTRLRPRTWARAGAVAADLATAATLAAAIRLAGRRGGGRRRHARGRAAARRRRARGGGAGARPAGGGRARLTGAPATNASCAGGAPNAPASPTRCSCAPAAVAPSAAARPRGAPARAAPAPARRRACGRGWPRPAESLPSCPSIAASRSPGGCGRARHLLQPAVEAVDAVLDALQPLGDGAQPAREALHVRGGRDVQRAHRGFLGSDGAFPGIEGPGDGTVDDRVLQQLLGELPERVLALPGDAVAQPLPRRLVRHPVLPSRSSWLPRGGT